MTKLNGTFEAEFINEDFVIVELNLLSFPDILILALKKENGKFFMDNFYFKDYNNHFNCPTCKRSHYLDDSLKCSSKDQLAKQIWNRIKSNPDFKTWLNA